MRFKIIAQVIGLCVFGVACPFLYRWGHPVDEAPDSGASVPGPISKSEMQSPSIFELAAMKFADRFQEGNGVAFDEFFDLHWFLQRVTNGGGVDRGFRSGYELGFELMGLSAFEQQILNQISDGGSFAFVRSREVEGQPGQQRLLFRLTFPGGGVDYHDYFVAHRGFGRVQAIDVEVMSAGELLSTTLRRDLLVQAAIQQHAKPDSLPAIERDYIQFRGVISEISSARASGKFERAAAEYERLPAFLKKDKGFALRCVGDALKTQNDTIVRSVAQDFSKNYPTDSSFDMILFGSLMANRDFDKALAAIDRIEKSFGSDAYWKTMRGKVSLIRGNLPQARLHFTAAEQNPDAARLINLQWSFAELSLSEKNFEETAHRLSRLHREFDVTLSDIGQWPEYAEFRKSPEYRQWIVNYPKALQHKPKVEPDAGALKIENVCTIGLPAKGFRWGEVRRIPEVDGYSCTCEKEQSPSRVTLVVEGRTRSLDGERSGAIKGHYNGLQTQLKELGFTIWSSKRPELNPPIPNFLEFSSMGHDPQNNLFFVHSITLFKTQTYLIQAFAATETEAKHLANVSRTLKEASEQTTY